MSEYRETYNRVFKGANESFKGKKINEENYGTYKSLIELAKRLAADRSRFGNIDYGFTEATSESRNALVYIETEPPAMISGEKEKIIATMAQDADDMIIAVSSSGIVRISFSVRDIWSD